MSTWIVSQNTIPSSIAVFSPCGKEMHCCDSGECGVSGDTRKRYAELPAEVRAELERRWREVFALPISDRQAWVDACRDDPQLIEVQ